MFIFAVRFPNEKFIQLTHVNLVFCAVCLMFYFAALITLVASATEGTDPVFT